MPTRMQRLEHIVADLPDAERVDIEEWGDHPTFRVRGKNFVFCDQDAGHLTVKLPHDEAAAVVAADTAVEPAGYGLGRHGWVSVTVPQRLPARPGGRRSASGCAPRTRWSPRNAWPGSSNIATGPWRGDRSASAGKRRARRVR